MGRSIVVDAISEMCRSRSVTHILMSPDTFKEYNSGINQHHVRSGIRRGTCHSVGILVVDGMKDELIFTFNQRRAKPAQEILRLIRSEQYEGALDVLEDVLARGSKWLHVGHTPGHNEESEEGEEE